MAKVVTTKVKEVPPLIEYLVGGPFGVMGVKAHSFQVRDRDTGQILEFYFNDEEVIATFNQWTWVSKKSALMEAAHTT
jgi:hypothetical protein